MNTFLEIIISIITLLVAVMAFAATIPNISMRKQKKQLKQSLDEYEKLNKEYQDLRASLVYLLFKTNYIDDKTIKRIEQIKYGKTQNNCGIYYLDLSRSNPLDKNKKDHYLEKALKCFNEAFKLAKEDEDKAIICVNIADVYDDQNNPNEAEKYCDKALVYKDDCSQAYSMLASIYLSLEKKEKARDYAYKALHYNGNNSYAYLTLAETYFEEFDKEESEKMILDNMQKALDLGCPVWDFYKSKIYKNIRKHDEFWSKCQQMIDEYCKNYNIVKMAIQRENDYTL